MPSYIEFENNNSLPPSSGEGKTVLGIDASGNISLVDNNGKTTSANTSGTNKLTVDFNSVGPKVSFTKTNYGSEVDVIIPGVLEITRGNQQGIYNAAVDSGWVNGGPTNTEWNSKFTDGANYGWINLLTAGDRTFSTWNSSVDGWPPHNIGDQLIMRETTTGRMWLLKFTQWTANAQGGGFAYERYELMPTVEFTRPDNEQNTVDEIAPGRTVLKRDSNPSGDCVGGGLYNAALESFYNSCVRTAPEGTEWNSQYINDTTYGFNDVSDVRTRKYGKWVDALNNNVNGYIIGLEMIMHDLATDSYYKFQFSSWTSGANGGGFAYTRTLIPLQQVITFSDGTVQETAFTPPSYKVYTALLSQSEMGDPTVIQEFENTFGVTPIFTRITVGTYAISLSGVVEEKTIFTGKTKIVTFDGNTNTILTSNEINYGIGGTDSLYINTYDSFGLLTDNVLDGWSTWIEIKVYN